MWISRQRSCLYSCLSRVARWLAHLSVGQRVSWGQLVIGVALFLRFGENLVDEFKERRMTFTKDALGAT